MICNSLQTALQVLGGTPDFAGIRLILPRSIGFNAHRRSRSNFVFPDPAKSAIYENDGISQFTAEPLTNMQSVYFLSKNQPDDDGSNFSELSSGLVLEGPEMQLENREELDVNPGHQPTPHPRAVGAPLPRGAARMGPRATPPRIPIPVPMPSRALTTPAIPPVGEDRSSRVQPAKAPSSNLQPSNVQRAAQALRSAVPFVQRLLPLLDGNIVTAISNVLNHQPKPAPPVSIAPIQQGISELQLQQRELSDQMAVQNALPQAG